MIAVLESVTKSYPGLDRPVLDGVSATIAAGETIAVVGPSGCGKSTLLNLLGGLDTPDVGRVLLGGLDLSAQSTDALAGLRAQTVGFVFQDHHLLPQCSAVENVLLPVLALPVRPTRAESQARARDLLAAVGLAGKEDRRPSALSGGERQRVAVARALINRPRLLLADEPTGALDQATASALADLLLRLNQEHGIALVVVTHSPALAARLGRRLELRAGRVVEPAA